MGLVNGYFKLTQAYFSRDEMGKVGAEAAD